VVDTGEGTSPYSAASSFAGNPLLLSLEGFAEQGLLHVDELEGPAFPEERVDFPAVARFKRDRLAKAFSRLGAAEKRALDEFAQIQSTWLPDYALFVALREAQRGAPWIEWDEELRRRRPKALASAR